MGSSGKPCNEFYTDALRSEGLSDEEIKSTLESQGFPVGEQRGDVQQESAQHEPVEQQQQHVQDDMPLQQEQQYHQSMHEVAHEEQPEKREDDQKDGQSRWPAKKKMPMKVVAAAAMAGAVPLFYGLSGSN